MEIDQQQIADRIYLIRGIKVMLDRDLADMYGVKAIRLREQVKRNLERFPGHFMFQLSEDEVQAMVSQNAIPSRQHLGGTLPYVFSEHGVLMLANVLKSQQDSHEHQDHRSVCQIPGNADHPKRFPAQI